MNSARLRARVSRRLRFRSRSAAASVALTIAALAAIYLSVEAVLALIDAPALVASPFELIGLGEQQPVILWTVVSVLALAGLVSALLAVVPGRFRRRLMDDDRLIVVVGDDVVAAGLSRAVARASDVSRGQVRTAVSRRRADVRVVPSSGFPVASEPGVDAGARVIAATGLRPPLVTRVVIDRNGSLA